MTVLDIRTGRPLDEAIARSQDERAVMERDFADDKKRIAYDLFMGRYGEMRYREDPRIAVELTDRTCFLCGGRFAPVGMVYGFWNRPSVEFVYVHRGCRDDSEDWSK